MSSERSHRFYCFTLFYLLVVLFLFYLWKWHQFLKVFPFFLLYILMYTSCKTLINLCLLSFLLKNVRKKKKHSSHALRTTTIYISNCSPTYTDPNFCYVFIYLFTIVMYIFFLACCLFKDDINMHGDWRQRMNLWVNLTESMFVISDK